MTEKEPFEQIPATRAGDRILRRRKKPRGLITAIFRDILRLFRSSAGS